MIMKEIGNTLTSASPVHLPGFPLDLRLVQGAEGPWRMKVGEQLSSPPSPTPSRSLYPQVRILFHHLWLQQLAEGLSVWSGSCAC